jgi:hypothetical protein
MDSQFQTAGEMLFQKRQGSIFPETGIFLPLLLYNGGKKEYQTVFSGGNGASYSSEIMSGRLDGARMSRAIRLR